MLLLKFLLLLIGFGFLSDVRSASVLHDVYLWRSNSIGFSGGPSAAWTPSSRTGAQRLGREPRSSAPGSSSRDPLENGGEARSNRLNFVARAIQHRRRARRPRGVRISQISGVRPGTLYAGTHLIFPLRRSRGALRYPRKVFSPALPRKAQHENSRFSRWSRAKGCPWGLPLPCDTGSIRVGSTTFKQSAAAD